MRLHHLRVTAFQAFAGTEQVDFDALSAAGLFLLRGDTGAGKTTLLDSVCFALYGEVPGARAKDARLRSDHASPELRTEVELDVTLRERRFRIVRRPKQERPKVRGEGVTEEGHGCTVQELRDGEWVTIAARPDEARAELADPLGMTCEQFCQVVLLPQGEFASFLRAGSDERWKLLERLFGTERFAAVEWWLRDRARTARTRAVRPARRGPRRRRPPRAGLRRGAARRLGARSRAPARVGRRPQRRRPGDRGHRRGVGRPAPAPPAPPLRPPSPPRPSWPSASRRHATAVAELECVARPPARPRRGRARAARRPRRRPRRPRPRDRPHPRRRRRHRRPHRRNRLGGARRRRRARWAEAARRGRVPLRDRPARVRRLRTRARVHRGARSRPAGARRRARTRR